MLNKRFMLVFALVVMTLALAVPAVQADAPAGDVVVRVFLDTNNDVHDRGERGLSGWTVELRGEGERLSATTGRNGFASFNDVAIGDYRVAVTPPSNGWRLGRSNADSNLGRTNYIVGGAFNITGADFLPRVNGDSEAWVRFSTIRVQRITISGAIDGDIFEFYRGTQLVGTDNAGPNGFAALAAGGLFYESEIRIVSTLTGAETTVQIPYGYQPKVRFEGTETSGTLTCFRHCGL